MLTNMNQFAADTDILMTYTLGHIHFGNSVAHAFRRFLRQLWISSLEI